MKRFLPLLIIFTVVFILFLKTFSVYFSQDDFFMFKVSQTDGTLTGFLNLLTPHPFSERGIAFYRPVFREALHSIYYSLFGLNHYPFRILMFVVHLINITLVFLLVKKMFRWNTLAYFTAFFFGISAAQVSTLYYLAGGIEAGGATAFALTTLIIYKKFLDGGRKILYFLSFLTFLLAIFSHEIVIPLSLIMLIMLLTSSAKKISLKFVSLLPFFIATIILLYIDLAVIGLSPGEKQYQAVFNPKTILNSFTWYSAWSLGLPETLIDFIGPGLKLNPTLMRYWGNFYIFIFSSFGISIATLAAIFIYLIKKSGNLFLDKRILLFLLWFPVGIAPVIFLPAHKSTHYLIFVLPAFWVTIIFTTLNFYRQSVKLHPKLTISITALLIISLIILSIASIKLGENTYWAATRGRLAEKLIKQVKSAYPALPEGAALYFTNDKNYPFLTEEWGGTSKQASLILNGSDAIQLLYKDRTLKVYYEDLGGLPDNLKNRRVYPQVAKLH